MEGWEKDVGIILSDGREFAGRLVGNFQPRSGEISIVKESAVLIFHLEEVRRIFFFGAQRKSGGELPGESIEEVETVDGKTFKVWVMQQQVRDEGFFGIPVDYDKSVYRIFFTQEGVRSRQEGRELGQILKDEGHVTAQGLTDTIKEQQQAKKQPGTVKSKAKVESTALPEIPVRKETAREKTMLGEILVSTSLISKKQLSEALEEQQKSDEISLGDLLVKKKLIDEGQLLMALALKFRTRFVDLRDMVPEQETMDLISAELAQQLHIFPVESNDDRIVVATSEPTNSMIADTIRFHTGLRTEMVVATRDQIREKLNSHYNVDWDIEDIAVEVSLVEEEEEEEDISELAIEAGQPPIVMLANKILLDGLREKASDIHILPLSNRVKVAFRINGLLRQHLRLEKKVHKSLVTRFKIMSGMDILNGVGLRMDESEFPVEVSDLNCVLPVCRAFMGRIWFSACWLMKRRKSCCRILGLRRMMRRKSSVLRIARME